MIGWLGDFLRFWWALFYWNTRKTWFRLHGAHRDSCPCQNYSDSGHALDSRCNAIIHWKEPARFRRVCPLLTQTKDGWRCGVDAERVRPFWTRALVISGASLLALYLAGTLAVFAFLRSASYDTRYRSVAWPPLWSELRASQEKLYATRAQQAIAAGRYPEAVLALQRVCELNPRNYPAALTLASLAQVSGQPFVAEHIYERLMRDVPEQRATTAEIWIRPLLSRAEYPTVKQLASAMLTEDPERREAWLHCLLFAARATRDQTLLGGILQSHTSLPDWCMDLIRIELLLLQDRREQAVSLLARVNHRPPSSYLPYYQADRLIRLGQTDQATALINDYGNLLPPDEVALLHLRIFQENNWTTLMEGEYETLLHFPLTPQLAAQLGAWFIRHSSPAGLAQFVDRFLQSGPAVSNETLPLYHAVFLAAFLNDDTTRADRVAEVITRFTSSDAKTLRALAGQLRKGMNGQQMAQLLPLVPLPLEVIYALLEENQGPTTP